MSKEYVLRDIGEIYDGPHATPKRQTEGKYFLNISSLDNGRLQLRKSDHISDIDYEKWTRRITPQANDLLFSYETRLGEAALMPGGIKAALGRRMALLRPDTSKVDPGFLLYKWLSPQWQALISERTLHGATVNRIPIRDIPDWPITLPPLSQQNAIASILRSLDDKIAVNNRIIETADCLVDALYHQVKKLPPNSTFGEEFEIYGGATPSTKNDEFWGGDIFWATPTDITALNGPWLLNTSRTITHSGLKATSSILHPENAILMTSRATIGKTALASTPITTNQGFIVIHAPKDLVPWLFSQLRNRTHEFESWANGATFLELPRGVFKTLPFIRCDKDQLAKFNTTAWPLLKHIEATQQENQTLARTRDELLPLLMSGKITVRDAEEASAEVGVDKHEVGE